jgi:hypothetical protein
MDTARLFFSNGVFYISNAVSRYIVLHEPEKDPEKEHLIPQDQEQIDIPIPPTMTPKLPMVLTHKLYLDIRQKNISEPFNEFTGRQHFLKGMQRSFICLKSAFFFFFQAIFPNIFKHYAPDLIIKLSEDILDSYHAAFQAQADLIV